MEDKIKCEKLTEEEEEKVNGGQNLYRGSRWICSACKHTAIGKVCPTCGHVRDSNDLSVL